MPLLAVDWPAVNETLRESLFALALANLKFAHQSGSLWAWPLPPRKKLTFDRKTLISS